jgi:hypothetical protein
MHTEEDLLKMALHVLYEIEEFNEANAECDRLIESGLSNPHSWNRTLESVLLHFRVLRGFFIDEPKKNDASVNDYVPGWSPAIEYPVFSETRTALDQTLAHLTWNRLTPSPREWDRSMMRAAIDNVFQEFKKSLSSPASEWFELTSRTRGWSDEDGNSTVSGSEPRLLA